MQNEPIRIDASEVTPIEDRFNRFRLISWWDQTKLSKAKILVVGAGALGNEIVKNLALLGIGHVLIADMDRIENSNLSRSVLYRERDNGAMKAEVAARAAKEIYPDMQVHYFNGNVIHDLGLGVYRWADLVIGGLDNREARLSINRNCWKVNRPWVDGAIEQIQGTARVFVPDGPCYECTMSERDWKLLRMRKSCNLLTRSEMTEGKSPTTPTISSMIAGLQCQEAVKLIHGMETIAGSGWFFVGLTGESFRVHFQRKEDCFSHETMDEVIPLTEGVGDITVQDLLQRVRNYLGEQAELELTRDVLQEFYCARCDKHEEIYTSLGKAKAGQAICPFCGDGREVVTFYKLRGDDQFLRRTLANVGVPPFDIVIARNAERMVGFELAGDARAILGPLSAGTETV